MFIPCDENVVGNGRDAGIQIGNRGARRRARCRGFAVLLTGCLSRVGKRPAFAASEKVRLILGAPRSYSLRRVNKTDICMITAELHHALNKLGETNGSD